MGANTGISWADDTFNPWIGCTKVSPACDGCYAENLMATRYGRVQWGAPGQGEGTRQRTSASNWAKPLKWEREQVALWAAHDVELSDWNMAGIGEHPLPAPPASRFVFCASLADVFDNAVPIEWLRDLFDLIHKTPHLTWLLLTKRPGNIVKLWRDPVGFDIRDGRAVDKAWPRNAAIGCTVVTQEEADRDIPKLLRAKATLNPAFAFVSMEPLLGPVKLWAADDASGHDYLTGAWYDREDPAAYAGSSSRPGNSSGTGPALDWVITGGETDQGSHKARPSSPAWFRALRDQCAAAGVAYHHKQNGEWGHCPDRSAIPDHVFRVGNKAAGRLLDGVTHDARPAVRP